MYNWTLPWILLAWPLPLILYACLPQAALHQGASLRIPFFQTLQTHLREHPLGLQFNFKRLLLPLSIWTLLLIALAGPHKIGDPISLTREGRDIMLAIDISKSMSLTDMRAKGQEASRLAVVKEVASEFIASRQGDRLGLLVFGSKAYIRAPLTFDRKTVDALLQDTTIGLAGNQTALGDAIGLAVKHLPNHSDQTRVLILLTDGVNNVGTDPESMAQLAAKNNVRIYTIAFGHDEITIDTLFGPQIVPLPLDEKGLSHIATLTQGHYFRAEDGNALANVYRTLNTLEPVASDEEIYRPIKALYYYPLALALLLSMLPALRNMRGKNALV